MKLFGVYHRPEHLDRQIAEIESYGVTGQSMLIELAPNHEALVKKGIIRPNFFMALRDHFQTMCSRIICGDQDLTVPENPDWFVAAIVGENYFYPDNRRDEIMAAKIEAEKPDIVVVGNGHTDYLKTLYPQANYIVFQPPGGHTVGHHGRTKFWNNPNRVITL